MKQNRSTVKTLLLLQMFPVAILLLSLGFTYANTPSYKATPITTPILREDLFQARLYHEIWSTIHFVDLQDLLKDEVQLKTQLNQLMYQCNQVTFCNHRNSLRTLTLRHGRIKNKISSIISLNDHRVKRGLINAVGTVSKFLFGTMSADDADTINKQIDEVYNTTGNIARLMTNQTTIIRSSLRQFENMTAIQNANLKILKEIVQNGNSIMSQNAFNSNLMESISDLELCFDDLLEKVNLVYESINDGKLGIVSPSLVSPRDFIRSLEVIRNQLSYKELPFSLSEQNYIFYMQISKITILVSRGKLVYRINTPIPTGPLYNVCKFIPVPMSGWTQYYIFENVTPKPIAFNMEITEYTVIDETTCTQAQDIKICEIISPIHRLHTEESCYSHLLKDREDKGCTRRYFALTNTFVLSLSNGYSWYILPKSPETIIITCGVSMETSITLETPHVFELASHCRGSSQNNLYLPRSHVNFTKVSEYKISLNFLPIEQEALKTPELKLPTFSSHHVDTTELLNSAQSLDDISKNLEIITSNRNKHTWLNTGYNIFHYIIYIVAGLGTIFGLYKIRLFHGLYYIFKACTHRCCPTFINCNNPVYAQEGAVSVQSPNTNNHQPIVQYRSNNQAVVSDLPRNRKLF